MTLNPLLWSCTLCGDEIQGHPGVWDGSYAADDQMKDRLLTHLDGTPICYDLMER